MKLIRNSQLVYRMEDFDTTIKIIVVGNGHVGKTSLTTRYCKDTYSGDIRKLLGKYCKYLFQFQKSMNIY